MAAPVPFFTKNGVIIGTETLLMWSHGMSRAGPQPIPSSGVRVSGGNWPAVSFGETPCLLEEEEEEKKVNGGVRFQK